MRVELDYYDPGDDAVFGKYHFDRASSFVPGPAMDAARGYCSAVALPGGRKSLVVGGCDQRGGRHR